MTIVDPLLRSSERGGGSADHSSATPAWRAVCALDALVPERGVAALIDGEQLAVFRLHDGSVRAVQQADPYADGANVMSRGLVGTSQGRPTVASPMYKQVFDLDSGACLDPKGASPMALRRWAVRVVDGTVFVGTPVRDPVLADESDDAESDDAGFDDGRIAS
jgi:NAD(P)H-dependent nitrite reductase small subunit